MILPFQTVALAVIALIGAGIAIYYNRLAQTEAAKLNDADRNRFYAQFSSSADRTNMPRHLVPLAEATDRVRGARAGVTIIVLIAVLFAIL